MRKWIIALAIMMVVPAVGAAATLYVAGPTTEQLVEGHTVFTVIQAKCCVTNNVTKFGAAVAVLVREINNQQAFSRFPGVLWFNDQYLVNPETSDTCLTGANAGNDAYGKASDYCNNYRYPCTGAVLAVNQGNLDPRPTPLAGYMESYLVTDPNDHMWNVDKYVTVNGFVWTTAINGKDAGAAITDDGTSNCAPYADNPCGGPDVLPIVTNEQIDRPFNDTGPVEGRFACAKVVAAKKSPGDNGIAYPTTGGKQLKYNAVLFFFLDDLTQAGLSKNHNPEPGSDRFTDASGCSSGPGNAYTPAGPFGEQTHSSTEWPCPDDPNDMKEGNSHAYNPANRYPLTTYDGKYNHGGSAPCQTGGTHPSPDGAYNDYMCHATRNIDLYYGTYVPPLARNYAFKDVEGSTAPYYCEDSIAAAGPCNNQDLGIP